MDDLAAETSEYYRNTVFQIINDRLEVNKALIVTTNLTSEQMKNPDNLMDGRIISRVLGKCVPILVNGPDRRREQGKKKLEEWRQWQKDECSPRP